MPIFEGQPQSVIYDPTTGYLTDANGNPVTGLTAIPWAKFIVDSSDPAVGVDPTILANYMISDRYVDPDGQRAIFQVDPTSTAANKRHLISRHLYTTWENRPSAAAFPGIELVISDYGRAKVKSDGSSYVTVSPQSIYYENNGTLASPTKSSTAAATSHTFTVPVPNIPAGLITPGKTIMRCRYTMQRRGTGGTNDFAIRLGTVGNSSDPIVTYHAGIAATNNRHVVGSSKMIFSSTTEFRSSRGNAETGDGANLVYAGGPTQFDTTQTMLVKVYAPAINAADTIDLMDFEWIWER